MRSTSMGTFVLPVPSEKLQDVILGTLATKPDRSRCILWYLVEARHIGSLLVSVWNYMWLTCVHCTLMEIKWRICILHPTIRMGIKPSLLFLPSWEYFWLMSALISQAHQMKYLHTASLIHMKMKTSILELGSITVATRAQALVGGTLHVHTVARWLSCLHLPEETMAGIGKRMTRVRALDLLEISASDADDERKVKSQYRRLALKWHPDKNPDNQVSWSIGGFIIKRVGIRVQFFYKNRMCLDHIDEYIDGCQDSRDAFTKQNSK